MDAMMFFRENAGQGGRAGVWQFKQLLEESPSSRAGLSGYIVNE
jgi:hypothetical protein